MQILGLIFVNNPPQWRFPVSSVTLWPLIRLVTGSKWNHSALLCDINGERVVVEAVGSGVIMTAVSHWQQRARRRIEVMPYEGDGAWLIPILGTPYDRKSLVVLKLLKMITGTWYGPVGEAAKQAVMCSELCALAVGHPHWWDVSPEELYRYLQTEGLVGARRPQARSLDPLSSVLF